MHKHIPSILRDYKTHLPILHPVIALHCPAEQLQEFAQNRPYNVGGHGWLQPSPK